MIQTFQDFRENLGELENAKMFLQSCLEQGYCIEQVPNIESLDSLEATRVIELSRSMLNIYVLMQTVPASQVLH